MARSSRSSARLKAVFARLSVEAKREIRKAVEAGAQDIVASAKAFAPVSDGDLQNSIGYTIGREYRPENANVRSVSGGSGGAHDLSATVHAGDAKAFYAAFVEFGTAPHTIRAKRPGGLLNVEGRLISRVDHPGASATPFFLPAYRANKRRVTNRINRAIRKATKAAAKS